MTDRIQMPLLDLMVCTTCELRCVACTNHIGGFDRLHIFPADEVKRDIDQAARLIHAEVAVLLGGEPLQHPRLLDLMRHARASGLADRVRVLTNGIRLHKMPAEFWTELQDLKISIYPGKTPPENIDLAFDMEARHGFQLSFYAVKDDPFRAVLTAGPKPSHEAQATYDGCWYRHNTRKVERGFLYRCCTSAAISKTVLGLPPDADGLELAGATAADVRAFLDRPEHANACTRCHGHLGPRLDRWSEERDRTRWLQLSAV